MDRRDFVRLAMISSALFAKSNEIFAFAPSSIDPKYYGKLQQLRPGSIKPKGWLYNYVQKQASELGSQLPDVSWPFSEDYWAGKEDAASWWPWEQKAYWLDGATRLALVLGDEQLLQKASHFLEYSLTHTDQNGYIGPRFFEDAVGDFHRWPQNVFFRALMAVADSGLQTNDIADALRKHYLSDKADYGKPIRNVTNIEGILWAYSKTKDPSLLGLAENAWKGYQTVASNPGDYGDLSEARVFSATAINAHGVTYAEIVKIAAILFNYTGKEDYLHFAKAAERRIFDHHMLIDGIPSTSEWYRTVTALDSHETCDIADHTWSWGYFLMATGESMWADRIERACFNAAPGAIKPDWKALQYFSCPNQFLATQNSDHGIATRGGYMMSYQPNPGRWTACCGGDVHRIFPNFVIRMWMKTPDNGLAAVLYGPSEVKTTVGENAEEISIVQNTDYPFRDHISFTIKSDHVVKFPLWLRVPGWCNAPALKINGHLSAMHRNDHGFLVIDRAFKSGDYIELQLPMQTKVSNWPQNGVGVERGPLVYSFPIPAHWTSYIVPKYSTKEFPSLDALPAAEWNYGIDLHPDKLDSQIEVTEVPGVINDPWSNPPVHLKVSAKKIPEWKLQTDPQNPEQVFTPPLPDFDELKASANTEKITLVPYGATQLRVTIFPALSKKQK
jgi:uncharacterized protein